MKRNYCGDKHNYTKREVESALRKGGTIREAAKILGCSHGTLVHVCDVLEIRRSNRGRARKKIPKNQLEKLARGFSWEDIAKHFSCSVGLVRREFKRHGLAKRDERSKNAEHPCEP